MLMSVRGQGDLPEGVVVPGLLEGKVVLVTGASSGIGSASARLFAREGAAVALVARRAALLEEVAEAVRADGGEALPLAADTTDAEALADAVDATVRQWGRLDGALNSAGRSQGGRRLADLDEALVDELLDVNLKGIWLAMRAEIRAMLGRGGGAVVNVGSIIGTTGAVAQSVYAATKAGLAAMSRGAAADYGPDGIRVNVLAPGTTRTAMIDDWEQREPGVVERLEGMTALGRIGTPDDMAEAAAWLLSDRSATVTGVVLGVNSGSGMWAH